MDEILGAFIEDGHELLAAMESGLLCLEDGVRDADTLNAIFRAAHTIKGDAGVVDLPEIENFTHVLENYLDMVRRQTLPISGDLVTLLLKGCDHIKVLFSRVAEGLPESDHTLQSAGEAIVKRLHGLVEDHAESSEGPSEEALALDDSPLNIETLAPPEHEEVANQPALTGDKRVAEGRQVRVSAEKLDLLVDMVGELVISTAAASTLAHKSQQGTLVEANAGVARLVEGIRELSLQLRMVQIGETFGRFRRVVRDMAREKDREIELVVRGEDTELDKTVVEKMADPLMHLIRNALDHGIETAEERVTAGKPARGRIELNAYHDTGGIIIEVADDGAGLDQEKILAKALECGVVHQGQVLSEREIFDLIFDAGFSTAEKVTHISGRGVGMDVVRSNVQALRGTIDVHSEQGRGSRFMIRLPLTMAIIDGFLVGAEKAVYVIPLDRVVECTELPETSRERNYLNLRGEVLPCIRLRDLFALKGKPPQRENVVVVKHADKKACIVVDVLLGEFQTVIKPLTSLFRQLRGVAGATILGTGEVALILDVQGLIQLVIEMEDTMLPSVQVVRTD